MFSCNSSFTNINCLTIEEQLNATISFFTLCCQIINSNTFNIYKLQSA